MKKLRNIVFIILFAAVIAACFSPSVRRYVLENNAQRRLDIQSGSDSIVPSASAGDNGENGKKSFDEPFPSQVDITLTPERETAEQKIIPTTIEGGMVVSNDTGYELDLNDFTQNGPSIRLPAEGCQILIVHTHGSEAFSPDSVYGYATSDNCRTEDTNYNMVRVGDELAACFESYGFRVIHDRGIYDYPSYTGSYARSGEAVQRYLTEHPEIAIVLDVHRDAIGKGDIVYKTVAESGGIPSSQLMLLCGTGENGLSHPNWRENLKLALYLQAAMVKKYPTLARPVALKKERYNQQLTLGSLILEIGSSGNTLSEALQAARLFAEAAAPALRELALKNEAPVPE